MGSCATGDTDVRQQGGEQVEKRKEAEEVEETVVVCVLVMLFYVLYGDIDTACK